MLVTEIWSRIPQENLGLGQAHLRELGSLLRSENECHKKCGRSVTGVNLTSMLYLIHYGRI